MNKKEVLEIRKQFTPTNCAITRIAGCYVDHEKIKKMESKSAFLSLPEEDAFKYFGIFRKTLSGSVGKNLLNLEFPTKQEMPGETQEFLMKLRKSKLEDDQLLEEFYDRIIESYNYGENYYIVLIHAMYDIPGRASDGTEMCDASEEVYEYLLCSICPVSLSKAGLSYHAESNCIQDRIRDWVVGMPDKGFLFPAFNDRSTDIHGVLYYTKKSEDLQQELIEQLLGARMPMSANTQKETFQMLIEDTLGEDGDYKTIRNIHDALNDMIEEHKEEPEPLQLDKADVRKVFEQSGVSSEKMESFDQNYEETAGEKTSLLAENITETKKFQIETPDIVIKVNPGRTDLVDTMVVNGRKCLVIAVDDSLEVNGIPVRTIERAENE
ncbi:putative DNA compactization protein [Ruminococcus phage phiRM10]|uniref:DNA compactization protein n=1 Tax=Ruminococcus phage phiRM10 TaxID=2772516 RepID=A0AAE7MVJ8_9CAUD|nr:putative DNA compactization protein [Ruminococcus phage phiRM10]